MTLCLIYITKCSSKSNNFPSCGDDFLAYTSIKHRPMVISWLRAHFRECNVWLPGYSKVLCWEQTNEKSAFVLHKGCSHHSSAGAVESGSLDLINHDLHSFFQHIQTQTHFSPSRALLTPHFCSRLIHNPLPGYEFPLFRFTQSKDRTVVSGLA